MTDKLIKCFVIMPFSKTTEDHTEEYWTKHYTEFLQPIIEQSGKLKAYRSQALREDILRSIITSLVRDPIVVADLTDLNPNVFWELGVRQSFKHGTITIKEAGTKIPFDLGTKGTLTYYPDKYIKNAQFRKDFQDALQDCLQNPDHPDSHVLETLSGRGSLYEIINRDMIVRRLSALITECDYNEASFKYLEDSERKIGVFGVTRFRISAIELLLSHRYISSNENLYIKAEGAYNLLSALNALLDRYPVPPGQLTENGLESISTSLEEMKKEVVEFKELTISVMEDFTRQI